jgi:hypothetical protein
MVISLTSSAVLLHGYFDPCYHLLFGGGFD